MDLIQRLKPDFVVKGKEHQSKINPEQAVVDSYGGKLIFSSGEVILSSLELLRKEFSQYTADDIYLPLEYMDRHNINAETLKKLALCDYKHDATTSAKGEPSGYSRAPEGWVHKTFRMCLFTGLPSFFIIYSENHHFLKKKVHKSSYFSRKI